MKLIIALFVLLPTLAVADYRSTLKKNFDSSGTISRGDLFTMAQTEGFTCFQSASNTHIESVSVLVKDYIFESRGPLFPGRIEQKILGPKENKMSLNAQRSLLLIQTETEEGFVSEIGDKNTRTEYREKNGFIYFHTKQSYQDWDDNNCSTWDHDCTGSWFTINVSNYGYCFVDN